MTIEVCEIQDGDLVIVTVPFDATERDVRSFKSAIQNHVGDHVRVILVPNTVSVNVVRKR